MIKISGPGTSKAGNWVRSAKKRGGTRGIDKSFSAELNASINETYLIGVEEMLSDLEQQERRFVDMQSLVELEKYKSMVKKILQFILNEGFENKSLRLSFKERSMSSMQKSIVETIDRNLVEISNLITKSSDGFALLKKIDEIRGLLFDLIH